MKKLIKQVASFAKLQIKDRYLGTSLGILWAILNPIIMLSFYTFIFGYIMKSKAPGAETSLAYAVWMISGLGPWLSIAESLVGGTNSIVGNAGLIKNLVFETEALPISSTLVGFIPLVVSLLFLLTLLCVNQWTPTWHLLLLIPAIVIHFLFLSGLTLIFSSINVFFRDFGILLSNILLIILFSTPIFYSIDQYPMALQNIAKLNPFYIITNNYRTIIITQTIPDPLLNIYLFLSSIVLLYIGFKFFRRLRGYFESVL